MQYFIMLYVTAFLLFAGFSYNDLQGSAAVIIPILYFGMVGLAFTIFCTVKYRKTTPLGELGGFLFGLVISHVMFFGFVGIKYLLR